MCLISIMRLSWNMQSHGGERVFCPTHLHAHIQLHNRLPKTSRDVFILINILLGAEKQSIITRKISFKGLFTVLINS